MSNILLLLMLKHPQTLGLFPSAHCSKCLASKINCCLFWGFRTWTNTNKSPFQTPLLKIARHNPGDLHERYLNFIETSSFQPYSIISARTWWANVYIGDHGSTSVMHRRDGITSQAAPGRNVQVQNKYTQAELGYGHACSCDCELKKYSKYCVLNLGLVYQRFCLSKWGSILRLTSEMFCFSWEDYGPSVCWVGFIAKEHIKRHFLFLTSNVWVPHHQLRICSCYP